LISAPALNAVLNSSSAVFLTAGYVQVRRHRIPSHRVCMFIAFFCSVAFLASYVIYHLHAGVIRFEGQGWIRPVYFTLLGTHTVLAIVIVPLAIITLSRALTAKFDRHRRIARWTLPIWLYVSVTGVIVYLLLYRLYPASAVYTRY
jgi:putative membrane protein